MMQLRMRLHYFVVLVSLILFYLLFFSPVLSKGVVIAGGETLLFWFPAVTQPWSIWSDMLMGGYPSFADSQMMTWYPLRHINLNFNLFVVLAYVVASFGSYGFTRLVTGGTFSGLVSAAVYSLGGFMMAHLGHTSIIHVAAWLPLIHWSLLRLSKKVDAIWIAVGAVAICCSFLGGHPQFFLYGMSLAALYAAFLLIQEWRLYKAVPLRQALCFTLMVSLGLALCAIQLLPLLEIVSLSPRKEMTFEGFSSFKFPLAQWPIVFFPNILGTESIYWPAYFGGHNGLVEVSCYFGMSACLLALIALIVRERRCEALFWTAAAIFAAIYALGDQTPVGWIAYNMPLFGQFRAPAGSVIILTFSMSMLAGLGAHSIENGSIGGARLLGAVAAFVVFVVAILIAVALAYPGITAMARQAGISLAPMYLNPAVLLPVTCALAITVAALALSRALNWLTRGAVLACVIVDLSHFGWFFSWQKDALAPPDAREAAWLDVRADLRSEGRIFPDAALTPRPSGILSPVLPNLNALLELPSSAGYTPLRLERYVRATNMGANGSIDLQVGSPLLALLNVKWVALPGLHDEHSTPLTLGSACGYNAGAPVTTTLPLNVAVTRIEVVSSLGCSLDLENGQDVLAISLKDAEGKESSVLKVEAGRDTSEWSIDNPETKARTRHSRATIYKSSPVGKFDAHQYITSLPTVAADTAAKDLQTHSVTLASTNAAIILYGLTLIDDTTGRRYPIPLWRFRFGDTNLWDAPIHTSSGIVLIRQKGPMPGAAWLVTSVRQETAAVVTAALTKGRLSDGSSFNPKALALLEEPLTSSMHGELGGGEVQLVEHQAGRWIFAVNSKGPGFLVVSQTNYPGWSATVNGRSTRLYSTNHAFQGLEVPDGSSKVVLSFASASLLRGAWISGASAAIVIGLVIFGWKMRLRTVSV